MKREDELALKVSKEIAVKFIETGRLSLGNFEEDFRRIHQAVRDSLLEESFRIDDDDGGGPP